MPQVEHVLREEQEFPTESRSGVASVEQGLEIAAQVRPTDLPLPERQPVIGTVAVAGENLAVAADPTVP
jgi:hypothetical protein